MPRLSDPDNKHPLLPSAGFDLMKSTRHKFIGFEKITIKYTTGERPANGLIFECEETGARRRWGYQ
jgi:hypothetical protein